MKAFVRLAFVLLLAVGCSGSSGRPDMGDSTYDVVADSAVTPDDGAETEGDVGRDASNEVAGPDLQTPDSSVDDVAQGGLPADHGVSADSAADVDGDPDGVAGDAADAVGADIPEDVGPVDVVADQGADVVSAGFCSNEDDQSIILGDAVAVDTVARDCYLECMGKPEPLTCNTDCIATNTGLSSDCAGCYTSRFECAAVNCLMVCTQDFGAEACLSCQEEYGCTASFQDCAGT